MCFTVFIRFKSAIHYHTDLLNVIVVSCIFQSAMKSTKAQVSYVCYCKYSLTHAVGIFLICYSSTLTLRILKRRYLAHAQCEALSPEARRFMKKEVQEELMKMQVSIFFFSIQSIDFFECFALL